MFTFEGGTDRLIKLMHAELLKSGVDVRIRADVEKIHGRAAAAWPACTVNGREIGCRSIVSNANLKSTIFDLVGEQHFDSGFVEEARAVRLNNSSCQVYMALKPGVRARREPGRSAVQFDGPAVPHRVAAQPRRHQPHLFVLLPAHAAGQRPLADRLQHQRQLRRLGQPASQEEYEASKRDLIETTLDALDNYVPDIREQLDHAEASTPAHLSSITPSTCKAPASAPSSKAWPSAGQFRSRSAGLYHAGSVGIIMSGWLGAMNYGVIVANDVDSPAAQNRSQACRHGRLMTHHEPGRNPCRHSASGSRSCCSTRSSTRASRRSSAAKRFAATSFFLPAIIPAFRSRPACCLCEAAMQAGAVLLASQLVPPGDDRVPVATRMNDVRFKRMVRPGDTVEIEVELTSAWPTRSS